MDLAASYRYAGSPVRIHAGAGALAQLPEELRRAGARRALVLCGKSVAHRTDLLGRVVAALGEAHAGTFDGIEAESPLPSVEAAVEAARACGADAVIGVGGGSAVVSTRATLILLAESGSAHDLCTQYPEGRAPVSPRLMQPKLPNVIVLTTPTTAANRAGAAVMDPTARRRLELFDPKTRPAAVILDPDALLTAPVKLYLSTATTTFSGLIGALQSQNLNPFVHADLREALDLSLTHMPRLVARPDDPDIRLHLATAALLANRAADAAAGGGGGVTNGLAHQLHVRYHHIDQGSANGVLLAPGMRFNRDVLTVGQARVGNLLGARRPTMTDRQAADAAAGAVVAFLESVGMPVRLRDIGVPEADLPLIAEGAMSDFFLRNNPRPVRDAAELMDVLRQAW